MAIGTGINAKLFMGLTTGATADQEIPNVVESTFPRSAGSIDATSRSGGGWKGTRPGIRSWGITFTMNKDETDPKWLALKSSFDNGTARNFKALKGTGLAGVTGTGYVMNFEDAEPVEGMQTTAVTVEGDGALSAA